MDVEKMIDGLADKPLSLANLGNPYILRDWAQAVHAYALEKGWWEGPSRDLDEVMYLVRNEGHEAFNAYRKSLGLDKVVYGPDGKPEGVVVEIADVVIRGLDVLCHLKGFIAESDRVDIHGYRGDQRICFDGRDPDLGFDIRWIDRVMSMPVDVGQPARNISRLSDAIWSIIECFERDHKMPLGEAIATKLRYNLKRPYRHGDLKA